MKILAIESSCDETACAIVEDGKKVLSSIVVSQIDIHKEFGGVVPEVASRHHVTSITKVIEKALEEANVKPTDLDLVAVTKGPGLIGSLLIGINAAKAFAYSYNLPLLGMHHIKGHIYANSLEADFEFPLLALVVSGGHTELVLMDKHNSFKVIGSTLDDAVGEAYDKVSRVMGLGYPGGPIIDKLAKEGQDTYNLPRALINSNDYDFSFSGIKSNVINICHNLAQRNEEVNKADMACSFQECVTDILVSKTKKAALEFGVKQVIVAGGVAANKRLREKMVEMFSDTTISVVFPTLKNCTDNASMIATAAYYQYMDNQHLDDLDLNGTPYYELGEM